jgi:anti-sigma factor RsiW
MTCAQTVRCLSDYIDGALAPAARDEVERHVESCHDCHLVLDTTQCTILLYRAARSTALVGARREQLLRRLEAACRDSGPGRP